MPVAIITNTIAQGKRDPALKERVSIVHRLTCVTKKSSSCFFLEKGVRFFLDFFREGGSPQIGFHRMTVVFQNIYLVNNLSFPYRMGCIEWQ